MILSIKQKLNSKRGVSVVLALFLMLVCAFAGSAALTSASANVGRYQSKSQYQQEYLATVSAAKLIIDDLDLHDDGISATYTSTSVNPEINYDFTPYSTFYSLIWEDEVKNSMQAALCHSPDVWPGIGEPSAPTEKTFTVTVNDEAFDDINVDVTLNTKLPSWDRNGNFNFTVSCGEYSFSFDVGIECETHKITDGSAMVTFRVNTESTEITPRKEGAAA